MFRERYEQFNKIARVQRFFFYFLQIGFLWSWNHMIANKHWKMSTLSNTPDSELFQLRILHDFRDFCSNQNNRLLNFWEDCWMQKEKMFTKE